MDLSLFTRKSEYEWEIAPHGAMRVPAVIYASEQLIRDMDQKVYEQACNVAQLPGIVKASYAMPDAHWGYGFPIGGVAAFDPDEGGVISAGGVGYDVSCGVRCLHTGLTPDDILPVQKALADNLYRKIPAGVGSTGAIRLSHDEMDAMLTGGARWAVAQGYGTAADLERIEEHGQMQHAKPADVSERAKKRQRDEMGTLGSGNHYLEVQKVAQIHDARIAAAFGLRENDVVVSIHCGSRGLGHQIGTEFLKKMAIAAGGYGIQLPDRELACAPINSDVGQEYLGAMRAAINCALANRQILTHLTREAFAQIVPKTRLSLLYDVSHNTCKVEEHAVDGKPRKLYVHRKGATRAFGPGHPDIPEALRAAGQPVLIGGSMGTASYVLAGTKESETHAFSSACHGAGRAMSRHQAFKTWKGRQVIDELAARGILIKSPSSRGVAEEAPGAYKDVSAVVNAADRAGLARTVARLEPLICIKG
ncbi:MAG: RNA-splicing ligase RtcB [Candidatus Muproteobacteria bacterium RBG_16_65_34]|uniref:tRNA-splicing ligase RtcB n=1 Tax=Candidatus Muproteobacteria bacterium RBG_16_65_34 TaxID=1817760 RepID=A0A1F6TL41_9PROT|nr:MAG: RNA-splicing ligase RtcB [Candidatus Muproteobacteria bacterium RBG_16_65_34]